MYGRFETTGDVVLPPVHSALDQQRALLERKFGFGSLQRDNLENDDSSNNSGQQARPEQTAEPGLEQLYPQHGGGHGKRRRRQQRRNRKRKPICL